MTDVDIPRTSATPGELCTMDVSVRPDVDIPRTSATPGELCTMDVRFKPDVDIPRTSATPGELCTMDVRVRSDLDIPRTSATPGELCTMDVRFRPDVDIPRTSATSGELCTMDVRFRPDIDIPRTSATPGELCTMDVRFRPDVDIPRTSSNPGEESAVEPGYGSVLGFSQVDSTQIRGGASDLECLPCQRKDCSAGPYQTCPYQTCPALGARMLSMAPSAFMSEMTAQQLLCPPVVAQTRPMDGCDPAVPRRLRRGCDDRTADDAVAVDARQVPTASDTVVSRRIHTMSECITTVAPRLEAAPQASHGTVQPKCSDCSLGSAWTPRSGRTRYSGRKSSGGNEHMQHSG